MNGQVDVKSAEEDWRNDSRGMIELSRVAFQNGTCVSPPPPFPAYRHYAGPLPLSRSFEFYDSESPNVLALTLRRLLLAPPASAAIFELADTWTDAIR